MNIKASLLIPVILLAFAGVIAIAVGLILLFFWFINYSERRLAIPPPAPVVQANSDDGFTQDWIFAELDVHPDEIRNAGDYRISYLASNTPNNAQARNFTAVYLHLDLEKCDVFYIQRPCGFTQVGLLTDAAGLHWFTYSYLPISCIQGRAHWRDANREIRGCIGDAGSIVQVGQWHDFRMVNSKQGYWDLMVYSSNRKPQIVSRVISNSNHIFRATSTFEQSYQDQQTNPATQGEFWHNNPRYMKQGRWRSWLITDGSSLNAHPSGSCKEPYGARKTDGGSLWYTGITTNDDRFYDCVIDPLFWSNAQK